jgi:serine/threonine protein kinase/tetratricopeptide (TPR) repeat protein
MPNPEAIQAEAKLGLIGPYRLIRPLAEGGMGIVYRAVHDTTEELVALKVVRVVSENLLASFRREIYALRSLDHPWVVRIVADGVHDGQAWYAMPLLRGQTLGATIDAHHGRTPVPSRHDLLKSTAAFGRDGPTTTGAQLLRDAPTQPVQQLSATAAPFAETLPPSERSPMDVAHVITLVRALCEPLAYVHGRGVVHRDLKPDNVIVREDGVPVLVDFGLMQLFGGGRTRDVIEVAGKVLGTPNYMAPEQIRGDLVDARADLYALGCILYEALTGAPPFYGPPAEILRRHLEHPPLPPSQLMDGIDPMLEDLVLRLLEKQPRHRLGFAADVAAALEEIGAAPPSITDAPKASIYLYRPALAGRGALVADLQALFSAQRGSCTFMGGKSGIGKTRLAMELATTAARRRMTVVAGQCVDVRDADAALSVRAAPLHPLRPLLHAIVDRCRAGSTEAAERILGAQGAVLAPYEPLLAELPSQRDKKAPPPLPAEAAKLRLLDALADVTARFAATRPLFLVLDDLQWADELSIAFLHHLDNAYFDNNQLVIIATYREEECGEALTTLLERDHVHGVHVGPLSRAAVDAMVGDMLALAEPPSTFVSFLMDESAGNPFFIAEYLRAAIAERILQRSDSGDWLIGSTGDTPESLRKALPMPGGLRDLIRRRVDRLSNDARALADMAAVLGRDVDGEVLLLAIAQSDETSRRSLEELRHRHILEEGELGHLRFTHDKLREFLYAQIPSKRRIGLHRAAAVHIERRHRGSGSEALHYPILAHHFGLAGDVPRTIHYLELAGQHALDSSAPGEACRFFARALELDDGRAQAQRRARWLRRLGEACYQTGDIDAAAKHLSAALDQLGLRPELPALLDGDRVRSMLSSLGALSGQVRSLLGFNAPQSERPDKRMRLREAALASERLSQVHYFQNEQPLAFGAALEAAHYAEGLGPSPELARAYAVVGVALGFVPLPRLVERYGRKAIAIASQVGDRHAIGFTTFLRGLSELNVGRHQEARALLERAIMIARDNGDVRADHEASAVLGHAFNLAGEHTRAAEIYERMLSSARRVRSKQAVLWSMAGLGITKIYMGDSQRAIELFAEVALLTAETGDRAQQLVDCAVAEAKMMAGAWDEALAIASHTLDLSEGVRAAGYHPYLGYRAACEVLLAGWERALAGAPFDASLPRAELARKSTRACEVLERHCRIFTLGQPEALQHRALWHWLSGHPRRARRAWQQSLALATELGMPAAQGRAHFELGRHLATGHRHRRVHFDQARQHWERIDAQYWLERLYAQSQ